VGRCWTVLHTPLVKQNDEKALHFHLAPKNAARIFSKAFLASMTQCFFGDMSTQTVTLKQVTWDTRGQDTLSGIITVTPALTTNFKSFTFSTLSGEFFRVQGFRDAFTPRFTYSGSHSSQQVKDLFQPGALLQFWEA
jgi:hypothetical protein